MKNIRISREQLYSLSKEAVRHLKSKGVKALRLDGVGGTAPPAIHYLNEKDQEVQLDDGVSKEFAKLLGVTAPDFFPKASKAMRGRVEAPAEFAAGLCHVFTGARPEFSADDEDAEEFEDRVVELEHSNVIRGVEIFSTGTHNKMEFTEKDLDDMVTAFKALDFKPALKIGHTKHEKGAPAFGWITNLKKVGTKLVADFESMHDSVVEAIRKKQYDRVSSEIYFDLKRGDSTFRRALRAVALLGAEVPAVAGLTPLHKIEFTDEGDKSTLVNLDWELDVPDGASIASLEARVLGLNQLVKENDMAGKKNSAKIAELKLKVEQFNADMKKMKDKGKSEEDDEMKNLKKCAQELTEQIAELEKADDDSDTKAQLAEAQKQIAALQKEKRQEKVAKLSEAIKVPALRPAVAALYAYALEHDETKVEVFSKTKDGKDQKEEKTLVEITNGMVEEINRMSARLFEALSTGGTRGKKADRDESANDDRPIDQIVDEKVLALQKEKHAEFGKDYEKALTFVLDQDPDLKEKYVASFGH